MFLTCLELCQEAAARVGIAPPMTIEDVSNPDPSKRNPDAMMLLAALNETQRQVISRNLFDPLILEGETSFDASENKTDRCYAWRSAPLPKDFGGLITSYVSFETDNGSGQKNVHWFFETDFDTFFRYYHHLMNSSNITEENIPQKNLMKVMGLLVSEGNIGAQILFCQGEVYNTTDINNTTFKYVYRSSWGIFNGDDTSLKSASYSFTKNNDKSLADDELLIVGTVCNYKSTQGINFDYDMQKYLSHIEALEKNRQRNNLFRDSMFGTTSMTPQIPQR